MVMPFYEIETKSEITHDVIREALRLDKKWHKYYNFDATRLPIDLLAQDPVLADIGSRHPMIGGVVMLPPNTFYNWHKDTRRGVSINMVLNPYDGVSHCVFTPDKDVVVGEFIELQYKPDTYYVFNTQVSHMVLNFDQPRLLMTIEFGEDKDALSYDDLLLELI
jgi:hypothetical protein